VFLEQLPVNVNMKVDRMALPAPTRENIAPITGGRLPRTDQERSLASVWQSLLGLDALGIDDDFFDLGGDSLRAVDLMSRIHREFGVVLPVSVLLSRPTIERLAPLLTQGAITRDPSENVICLRSGNAGVSVFLVHDGEGEVLLYRNLANRMPPNTTVYGILPKTNGRQPIVQTRIGEIVEHYAQLVEQNAPHGPVVLGGLCIGGFLAFEVARELGRRGRPRPPVLLIDVAHVSTPPRSVNAQRSERFSSALEAALRGPGSMAQRTVKAGAIVLGKAASTTQYLARRAQDRALRNTKVLALRWFSDRKLPIPNALPQVSVDSVLRFAEREYRVPEPYLGRAVLFCATLKQPSLDGTGIDDTPYRDLFVDRYLGWQDKVVDFSCVEVAAGHSSILQEPHVAKIAEVVTALLEGLARMT
jgi:thioesterase domain-containing protein/acyl carrier protein